MDGERTRGPKDASYPAWRKRVRAVPQMAMVNMKAMKEERKESKARTEKRPYWCTASLRPQSSGKRDTTPKNVSTTAGIGLCVRTLRRVRERGWGRTYRVEDVRRDELLHDLRIPFVFESARRVQSGGGR